jgi:hypothetical protein
MFLMGVFMAIEEPSEQELGAEFGFPHRDCQPENHKYEPLALNGETYGICKVCGMLEPYKK